MPSIAYSSLATALGEVSDLSSASAGGPNLLTRQSNRVHRSASRGAIVLLSSHFERYLYAVNEEVIGFVNAAAIQASSLSNEVKLLHSKVPLEEMAEMDWLNRGARLQDFVISDGWLWNYSMRGALTHTRLLAWMKSPKPDSLVRYYRYWGIQDVFSSITRTPSSRGRLRLGILELVDKRNSIAHGDFNAVASLSDIKRYMDSVQTFCKRADVQLARAVTRICNGRAPW
jgi:RiboL-PSP-HEPN